jgi:hypothetical protein
MPLPSLIRPQPPKKRNAFLDSAGVCVLVWAAHSPVALAQITQAAQVPETQAIASEAEIIARDLPDLSPSENPDFSYSLSEVALPADLGPYYRAPAAVLPVPALKDELNALTMVRTPRSLGFFSRLLPSRETALTRAQLHNLTPRLPAPDPRQSLTRQAQDGGALSLGYGRPWLEGQLQLTASLEPSSDNFRSHYTRPLDTRDLIGRDSVKLGSMLSYRQTLDDVLDINLNASLRREISDETVRQDSDRLWLYNVGSSAVSGDVSGRAQWRAAQGISLSLDGQASSSERYTRTFITADDQIVTPWDPLRLVNETRSNVTLASTVEPLPKVSLTGGVSLISQTLSQSVHQASASQISERDISYLKPDVRLRWQPVGRLELNLGMKQELSSLGYDDLLQPELASQVRVAPAKYLYSSVRYSYPLVIVPRIMTGELSLSTEGALISGVIDHTPLKQGDSFVDIKSNIGEGHTRDVSARLNLNSQQTGVGSSAFEMSATWRTSRVTDPLDQSSRPISNQAPLSLNLNFRQSLEREGVSWGVRADNGWQSTTWRINEVSVSRATPQVDLFAEFLPVNGLKLRAELNNITRRNLSYERFSYDGLRTLDGKASESQWSQAQQPYVVLRLMRGL